MANNEFKIALTSSQRKVLSNEQIKAINSIRTITETLNLEKTKDILFLLLTHYLTYEDGLSTEHKEDVCFTVKTLNEAISGLVKTA